MKRLKMNIIYLLGLLVLSCAIIVTFAAFIFNQTASVETTIGDFRIDSKNYLIYARSHSLTETDDDYQKAEKERNDTVATINSIVMGSTKTYSKTTDTNIVSGKTYYTRSGSAEPYTYSPVALPTSTDLNDYYEASVTYTGIDTAVGYYYDATQSKFIDLVISISGSNNEILSFTVGSITVSIECEFSQGVISSAEVDVTNKNYKVVLGVDGLSMVIIDTDISENPAGYAVKAGNSNIKCSATEAKFIDENQEGPKYYLSQIGFQFSFTSKVACYVRIQIQDAWTRTREYSSSTNSEKYVMKDQVGGKSPFAVTDSDWFFDPATSYIYLKEMYVPSKNQDGTFKTESYTFNVNEAYYYLATSTTAYKEYIDVDLSFNVQIVQANRIYKKWNVDPSIFNS